FRARTRRSASLPNDPVGPSFTLALGADGAHGRDAHATHADHGRDAHVTDADHGRHAPRLRRSFALPGRIGHVTLDPFPGAPVVPVGVFEVVLPAEIKPGRPLNPGSTIMRRKTATRSFARLLLDRQLCVIQVNGRKGIEAPVWLT